MCINNQSSISCFEEDEGRGLKRSVWFFTTSLLISTWWSSKNDFIAKLSTKENRVPWFLGLISLKKSLEPFCWTMDHSIKKCSRWNTSINILSTKNAESSLQFKWNKAQSVWKFTPKVKYFSRQRKIKFPAKKVFILTYIFE